MTIKTLPIKKRLKIQAGDAAHKRKKLKPQKAGFRTLLYHSITDKLIENEWPENTTPKDLFCIQMKYLSDNNYNVISCDTALEHITKNKEIPPRAVAITFDDGFKDNYRNALPALKKYSFPATIFLAADYLNNPPYNAEILNQSEIREIRTSGIIDFGCHGLTHRALTTLGREELDKEIAGAKNRLEDIINGEVSLFAYPFGHVKSFNKGIVEKIKRAGFKGGFTTVFGLNDSRRDPFSLRRNRISWLDNLGEFEKHLNGSYDWYAVYQYFMPKRYEA